MNRKLSLIIGSVLMMGASQVAVAACTDVTRDKLVQAVGFAEGVTTGGYGLPMWVTMVDETGMVCHVVTGGDVGARAGNSEWLGSRVISAQKANTANAFSLDGYAISTANLYSAVQPGGSLYGLQHSNPVDASRAYGGGAATYGTNSDFLRNKRIGGVNVFGGGLALYKNGAKIGAIGVSGDTSCRDHAFAWTVRDKLLMEPGGDGITTVNMNAAGAVQAAVGTVGDEMIFDGDTAVDAYWDAWAHPQCPNTVTGDWSVTVP